MKNAEARIESTRADRKEMAATNRALDAIAELPSGGASGGP